MPKAHKGKRSQRGYSRTVLFAYHEAGHAVVGHAIGRCIEEISILSHQKEGYKAGRSHLNFEHYPSFMRKQASCVGHHFHRCFSRQASSRLEN